MPPKRTGYHSTGRVPAPGSLGTADALPETFDCRVVLFQGATSGKTYVVFSSGMPDQLPPQNAKATWQCKTRRKEGSGGCVEWHDAFHGVKCKGTIVRFQVMAGEGKNVAADKVVGTVELPMTDICKEIGKVLDTIPGQPLVGGSGALRVRVLAKGGALEEMPASPMPWCEAQPGARTQADLAAAMEISQRTFAEEKKQREAMMKDLTPAEKAELDAAAEMSKEQWEKELQQAEAARNATEGDYDSELAPAFKGTELEQRRKQREELDVFRQTRMTMTIAKFQSTRAEIFDDEYTAKEQAAMALLSKQQAEEKKQKDAAARKKREEEEAARKAAEEAERQRIQQLKELRTEKQQKLGKVTEELSTAQEALADAEDQRLEAQEAVAALGTKTRLVHNELEDLRGKIRVFCRTRPERKGEAGGVLEFPGGDCRSVIVREGEGLRTKAYDYLFDRAFPGDTSQEEVFAETKGMIQSSIDGYNCCIFAYGQTGSGKTHTLVGSQNDPGIARRSMRSFFEAKLPAGHKLQIECSMVELYIDTFFDLLGTARKPLKLKRAGQGCADIDGRTWCPATSYEALVALFAKGEGARSTRCTSMNERSSRSHMIFVIRVTTNGPDGKPVRTGQYALVDLAGSERIKKSGVEREGLREAVAINKSLTALGNVISSMSKGAKHVPYRDHELTQAMESFLTGNAKMLMFVNVSPARTSVSESRGSLTFAQRTKQVQLADAEYLAKNKAVIQAKEGELQGLMSTLHRESQRAGEKEIEADDLKDQIEEYEGIITELEQDLAKLDKDLKGK
eukprot:TRINITY_DN5436_c0_g1_i1.p1 TRINITY_DN5436_c0_g1~~TRINITY_DN5436_c0_g1_i1.p1  ORF type:complete len:795 (+),score=318.36 TRINITY_DN5436_c0_g1_i1:89-2473(+)